jgi:hypothetical protein
MIGWIVLKRTPIKDSNISFDDPGITVKVLPGSKVSRIEFDSPMDELTNKSLRSLAKIKYVTSQTGISLNDLSKVYPFDRIPLSTLTKWSRSDHWVDERDRYRASLEVKVLEKLGQAHVQAIASQLKSVDSISEKVFSMLGDLGAADVKSYEGLLGSLVRLEKFRFEARKEIADIMKSTLSGKEDNKQDIGESISVPKITHSKEAIRQAAFAIIKANRELNKKKDNE